MAWIARIVLHPDHMTVVAVAVFVSATIILSRWIPARHKNVLRIAARTIILVATCAGMILGAIVVLHHTRVFTYNQWRNLGDTTAQVVSTMYVHLAIAIAAIVCLGVAWFFRGRVRTFLANVENMHVNELAHGRKGIYVGPIRTFLLRFVISPLVGVVAVLPLYGFDWLLGYFFGIAVMNSWFAAAIVLIVAAYVGQDDPGEPMRVPEAHAAMLTVFGFRIRVYLTEGYYPWIGRRLFIGRSQVVKRDGVNDDIYGTDQEGFISLENIPIRIWNTPDKDNPDPVLRAAAKNNADVYTNLLLTLQLRDPKLWIESDDPVLDLADRARASLRTAVAFFLDTDCVGVKHILGSLMSGKTVVTCFIRKPVGSHAKGAMLRDSGGDPMFMLVEPTENETYAEAKERIRQEFKDWIYRDADSDMRKQVPGMSGKVADRDPVLEFRTVKETLNAVLDAIGTTSVYSTVAYAVTSEIVSTESNKASGETFQHDARVKSAEAIKAATRRLRPTKAEAEQPHFELARLMAGEQDAKHPGSYKLWHVNGLDRLMTALAGMFGGGNNQSSGDER